MHLADPVITHFRLTETHRRALKKLQISTIEDLLNHLPARYETTGARKAVTELTPGETVTVYGTITKIKARKAWKRRIPIAEGTIEDGTGKVKVMWFNQPYIAKMYPEGSFVKVSGKVAGFGEKIYIGNPEIEIAHSLPAPGNLIAQPENLRELTAIYPESRGVTSNWFVHAIERVLKSNVLDEIEDPIPSSIRSAYNLPDRKTALRLVHSPRNPREGVAVRKRFAFEEVFFIQLAKQKARHEYQANHAFTLEITKEKIEEFTNRFSFPLTNGQQRAIDAIVADMKSGRPMSRLLEGDVGSGKTAVAATTAYATITTSPRGAPSARLQVAYMAPTEILAKQHFESFISYFNHLPIQIGLITGSGCFKFPSKVNPSGATSISRTQLLKWVANGEIPILIGTHALIQKAVKFKNLAYVIIDEQHRFGTTQRQKLVRKDAYAPHFLSMTATPIPRTLALTIYGDLDLTLLDENPPGRKPIVTELVAGESARKGVYEKIRAELAAGRQTYVICPRIDLPAQAGEPGYKEFALEAKSVKEEAARLKRDVFPEYEVAILHSKMSTKEKDETMERFAGGEIKILVATSVVEVGVNVPNATVIIIEGAERFGLSQLHQLRGRVLRSSHQAYCYIFADSKGKMTTERLKAIKNAKNGFELAEYDLKLRGAGELGGGRQWGLSDIAMEAIQNLKMVEAARIEATKLIEEDPTLERHPDIAKKVAASSTDLHFE